MNKLLFFILIVFVVRGNAQNYINAILDKSCECVNNVEPNASKKKLELKLGLCVIEASLPYKKELLNDHNINLDEIDTNGKKLGTLIGLKMASYCPKTLLRITELSADDELVSKELIEKGKIVKVENNLFITFSLKNDAGKTAKFYWLSFIDSDNELVSNYKSMSGKKVVINYTTQEFFDAKIGEYRLFNINTKFNLVKN